MNVYLEQTINWFQKRRIKRISLSVLADNVVTGEVWGAIRFCRFQHSHVEGSVMILQIATLNVKPGGEAEFHAAFKKVVPFVSNLR
jgi:hypothetical protein